MTKVKIYCNTFMVMECSHWQRPRPRPKPRPRQRPIKWVYYQMTLTAESVSVSEQHEHLHTVLCKPISIGLGLCQCERSVNIWCTYFCLFQDNLNWNYPTANLYTSHKERWSIGRLWWKYRQPGVSLKCINEFFNMHVVICNSCVFYARTLIHVTTL